MKKIILAGIRLSENRHDFDHRMEECESLCYSCGYEVAGTIVQNSQSPDRNTAFRAGKIEELKSLCAEKDADGIVFCNELPLGTAARIAEETGISVIDRTSLILDIFSLRARTRQSRIQTEMARLQYALPSLRNLNQDSERSRGGSVNNRGAGEMRSALVARRYRSRISELKKELSELETRRTRDESRRARTKLRKAALVGYTNAGKSSLMNAILEKYEGSGQKVFSEDMLFATLDTSVRAVTYRGYSFLLYDTVGFVSDMPSQLLDAFHSTLSVACEADLLINVVDGNDDPEERIRITEETMEKIHASDIPVLRVFNKSDLSEGDSFPSGLRISCLNGEGLQELMERIIENLYPKEESYHVFLPYDKMALFDAYRKVCSIQILEKKEEGMLLEVAGPAETVNAFAMYRV